MIKYTVNGRSFQAPQGITIMEALLSENIEIPRLCYDPRLHDPNRSCGLCIVKLEKEGKIVRSCDTPLREGMVITTNSKRLREYRKVRMEQLLSDHNADCVAPCQSTCPAGIDIQGYLKHTANGNFSAALKLIKENNPFPLICGRVCPHPCEAQCRRNLVDDAVNINGVKRFVADYDLYSEESYIPKVAESTGKKIAIVGGGPSGLSAAYYSAIKGHEVTVFEKRAKMGGMTRYGIPDYRLPQDVLDKEIEFIEKLGVTLLNNKALGINIRLENLQKEFDAVYLAVGSWQASSMRVEGEQLPGVWKGIEYLEQIAKGKNINLGDNVIVVGGGNTAVDCARTALRKGAGKVSIVYRRSQAEMPAESYEIEEAIKEGINMVLLTAPVGFESDDCGKLTGIKCSKMELGEADLSGRRRAVLVEGSEHIIEATAVIGAIGQKTDTAYLWNDLPLKLNKWGDIEVNGKTMETSEEKIFAGGDCVTGPATVVQAVAAGKQAAESMAQYLICGYAPEQKEDYSCSRGTFEDLPRYEFANLPKLGRASSEEIPVDKAISGFDEVAFSITAEEAMEEAKRCLECGCNERHDCQLRKEATMLEVSHDKEYLIARRYPITEDHPFIVRDTSKCISCGKCVAACNEIEGPGVLGFYLKQGKLCVGTKSGKPLSDTACVSCGQCVVACPCGALDYKRASYRVFKELNKKEKKTVAFVAPAVRSLICSHYGLEPKDASPFIAGMLKKLGFDKVFDFTFAADLTIVEETTEFLGRLQGGVLPQFTSCCPGWVNFVEKRYPELIPNLSSCKSPQQMMGATVKNHLPLWLNDGTTKEDIFVVSVVPCMSKKGEAAREEFEVNGIKDVDEVLTSVELIEMMEQNHYDASDVEKMDFDKPYEQVSGAGILFGASGGVAEAALRMAASKLRSEGEESKLEFNEVRGLEGIKTVSVELDGKVFKVAVVSGLKNAEPIINNIIRGGRSEYDLIEIMACPGGCVSGAGHPVPKTQGVIAERQNVLVEIDKNSKVRRSEENPDILRLYDDFYGDANSKRAHELLHTHYTNRMTDLCSKNIDYAESVWATKTIEVCVDKNCYEKGSHDLIEKINEKIKKLKLENHFRVKPVILTGHSKTEGIFVSVDGKKVNYKEIEDIESWLLKES
ncbi:NAD(P)-binding protein [Clostridium sediminicola]|uniref:NAD(P)-binding protein n=1 Tax=Clostridium sediminicola TaxID=3114879 RepID=UPI0031F27D64